MTTETHLSQYLDWPSAHLSPGAQSYREEYASALFSKARTVLHSLVDTDPYIEQDDKAKMTAEVDRRINTLRNRFLDAPCTGAQLDSELYNALDDFTCEHNLMCNLDAWKVFAKLAKAPDWQSVISPHPLKEAIQSGDLAAFAHGITIEGADLPILVGDTLIPPLLFCLKRGEYEMASLLIDQERYLADSLFSTLIKEEEIEALQWLVLEASALGLAIPYTSCLTQALYLAEKDFPKAAPLLRFLVERGAVAEKSFQLFNFDALQDAIGPNLTEKLIAESPIGTNYPLLDRAAQAKSPLAADALIQKWGLSFEEIAANCSEKTIGFYLERYPLSVNEKITILTTLLKRGSHFSQMKELLMQDLQTELPRHTRFLFFLVRNGFQADLEQLKEIDWEAVDSNGNTLLHAAYQESQLDIALYLKSSHVFPNSLNAMGETIEALQARAYLKHPLFSNLHQATLDEWIHAYGVQRVIRALEDLKDKIPRRFHSRPIAHPEDAMHELLEKSMPFCGQPIVLGFDGTTPRIQWDLSIDPAFVDTFAFANPSLKPSNLNRVLTFHEMQDVLDSCRDSLPTQYLDNGCVDRADWIARILQETLGVKTERHIVYPPAGTDHLKPGAPIPDSVEWTCHHVPVVKDSKGDEWALDVTLPHPMLLEEWKKWVHTPTEGASLQEFRRVDPYENTATGFSRPLSESLWRLGRMHLMEKTHEEIVRQYEEDWLGPNFIMVSSD